EPDYALLPLFNLNSGILAVDRLVQKSHQTGLIDRRLCNNLRILMRVIAQKVFVEPGCFEVPVHHQHAVAQSRELHGDVCQSHCASYTSLPGVERHYCARGGKCGHAPTPTGSIAVEFSVAKTFSMRSTWEPSAFQYA